MSGPNAAAAAVIAETRVCFWMALSGSAGSGASVGPLFTWSLRSRVPRGANPVQNVSNQATVGASRSGDVPAPSGATAEPSVVVPWSAVVSASAEPFAELEAPELSADDDAAFDVTALGLVAVPDSPDEQPTTSNEQAATTDKSDAARFIPVPSPTRPPAGRRPAVGVPNSA